MAYIFKIWTFTLLLFSTYYWMQSLYMTCTVKWLLDYLYGLEETVKGNRYHQSHDTLLSNTKLKRKKGSVFFLVFWEDFHLCFKEGDVFFFVTQPQSLKLWGQSSTSCFQPIPQPSCPRGRITAEAFWGNCQENLAEKASDVDLDQGIRDDRNPLIS